MTRATTLGNRIGLICVVVLAVSTAGIAWAQGKGKGQSEQRVGPSFTIPPLGAGGAPTGSPLMTPDPSGTQAGDSKEARRSP
jgi:hypothetical protein